MHISNKDSHSSEKNDAFVEPSLKLMESSLSYKLVANSGPSINLRLTDGRGVGGSESLVPSMNSGKDNTTD